MVTFFSGMVTMGLIISGLFFLRFWYRTGDNLFAAFALAFWLLAINEAWIALPNTTTGASEGWAFVPRIAAFALLILAILVKNLDGSDRRSKR